MRDNKRHSRLKLTPTLISLALAMSATASSAAELEEVVVTATKRAESMQTIPLSITAVSGEELAARGATEFVDYATSIPNLSFGAATDGVLAGRSISLRGIAGANTTGFYIDDTPISETIDPRILDLERVEVLRGPSGTLYGGRSLGGTIRQITRKPDLDEQSGKFRAGLSQTDESGDLNYLMSGSVNLPLTDKVAAIFSGFYEEKAGVFDRAVGTIPDHVNAPTTFSGSPTAIIEDVDSQQTVAFQAAFLIQATDNLTIEPRVMYQKTELDGFPLADIRPGNFVQNRDFDTPEGGEDEWTLSTLNINYTTDYGTFTSASSYFDRETFEREESGAFINSIFAFDDNPVSSPIFQQLEFQTTVQEFRFSSDLDGPTNFVAGAFYQKTDDNENFEPRNYARGLDTNTGGTLPFGDLVFTAVRPTEITEKGLFGELSYDLTDKLSMVLGARLYDTEVNFSQRRAGLAFGVPLAEDAPLSSIPAEVGEQAESGSIYKAAVEYQATDNVFVYGLVAQGFRLGGANSRIPNTLGCPADLNKLGLENLDTSQYQSDDLISYEVGAKLDIGESTRLNATAFFIEFDGIQQPVQLSCGFQFVGNFGAAESKGVELELTSQITESLMLLANFGYTDAEFTETVFGGAVNTSGDPLQFVPEITASASVDYESGVQVYRDMNLFVRADVSYVDESLSLVNGNPRVRDSYEQVGLRLGLRNDKYTVTLFANNLTNDIANLADNRSLAAETPGRPRFVTSRPRTIGLQFDANF